jgi:hypothetical protein
MREGTLRQRTFDWDEAKRLRAEGLSYAKIGAALGVSYTAVYLAVNDEQRERQRAYHAAWQKQGPACVDCGKTTSRNRRRASLRCADCRNAHLIATAPSVHPDTLRCYRCRKWKPDDDFYRSADAKKARRGRKQQCKQCDNTMRREHRQRHGDACAECGAPTGPHRELDADARRKGFVSMHLCRSCAAANARKHRYAGA